MIYSFGECELHADLRELRVGGDVRTIEPQISSACYRACYNKVSRWNNHR